MAMGHDVSLRQLMEPVPPEAFPQLCHIFWNIPEGLSEPFAVAYLEQTYGQSVSGISCRNAVFKLQRFLGSTMPQPSASDPPHPTIKRLQLLCPDNSTVQVKQRVDYGREAVCIGMLAWLLRTLPPFAVPPPLLRAGPAHTTSLRLQG